MGQPNAIEHGPRTAFIIDPDTRRAVGSGCTRACRAREPKLSLLRDAEVNDPSRHCRVHRCGQVVRPRRLRETSLDRGIRGRRRAAVDQDS
jgi:hypothetical protein